MSIQWKEEKRKLQELTPYEKNPRKITEDSIKDLKDSVDRFGLAEPIVINRDNVIIGGHARYFVLNKENPEQEVSVYVPDRLLTEKEVEELNIRLNKNIAGFWDYDILANQFELDELKEWGFSDKDFELGSENFKEPEHDQSEPEVYDGMTVMIKVPTHKWPEVLNDLNTLERKHGVEIHVS